LLLLLAYVCLDIANPLMPGVVQLVHGTIRMVEAGRARAGGDAPIPVTLPLARLTATPVRGPSPLRRLRPVLRTLRERPLPRTARAPFAEDH
jgi:hypothetical protein